MQQPAASGQPHTSRVQHDVNGTVAIWCTRGHGEISLDAVMRQLEKLWAAAREGRSVGEGPDAGRDRLGRRRMAMAPYQNHL